MTLHVSCVTRNLLWQTLHLVAASLAAASAAFGDVVALLFFQGATFGDVGASLFLAGHVGERR